MEKYSYTGILVIDIGALRYWGTGNAVTLAVTRSSGRDACTHRSTEDSVIGVKSGGPVTAAAEKWVTS